MPCHAVLPDAVLHAPYRTAPPRAEPRLTSRLPGATAAATSPQQRKKGMQLAAQGTVNKVLGESEPTKGPEQIQLRELPGQVRSALGRRRAGPGGRAGLGGRAGPGRASGGAGLRCAAAGPGRGVGCQSRIPRRLGPGRALRPQPRAAGGHEADSWVLEGTRGGSAAGRAAAPAPRLTTLTSTGRKGTWDDIRRGWSVRCHLETF